MKTAILRSGQRVELIEQEMPKACDDFAVVKVHTAPMCTEFYKYRDGEEDLCMGHEAAGEVVEVARPGKFKPGDRVVVMPQYPCGKCSLCLQGEYIHCEHIADPLAACNCESGVSTYSQYVLKQDWLLIPIPDGMSYDHASMACCGLGASFGAIQSMGAGPFDTVLIGGLGPVGLGAVINCMVRGSKVIGVARNRYRAALAMQLGATAVLDPEDPDCIEKIRELTGGKGADQSVDCSGGEAYQQICIRGTRRKGQVAFVGESGKLTLRVSDDLIRNGLILRGAWHWNLMDTPLMMETIRRSAHLIDKLITHTYPLTEVEDAFKLQMTGQCGKVLLRPQEMK
jgi:L-iditol 2-dehydrogenase